MNSIGHSLTSDDGPIPPFGAGDEVPTVVRSSRTRSRLLQGIALVLGLWVISLVVAGQARADDQSTSTEPAASASVAPPEDGGQKPSAPSTAAVSEAPVSQPSVLPADSSAASTPSPTAPSPLPPSTGTLPAGDAGDDDTSGTGAPTASDHPADPGATSPPAGSTTSGTEPLSQPITAAVCAAEDPAQPTPATADSTLVTAVSTAPQPGAADREGCASAPESGGAAPVTAAGPTTAAPTTAAPTSAAPTTAAPTTLLPAPTGAPATAALPVAPPTSLPPAALPGPLPAGPTVVQAPAGFIALASVDPCPSAQADDSDAPQVLLLVAGAAGLLDPVLPGDGGGHEATWTARHSGRPTGSGGHGEAPAKLSPSNPHHGGAPPPAPGPPAPPAPLPAPSSSCSSAEGGTSASSAQSRRVLRTGLPYCVLPPDTDAVTAVPEPVDTAGIAGQVRSTADEPGFAPD